MKTARCLFVHYGHGWGGAPEALLDILKALLAMGNIKATVACLDSPDTVPRFKAVGADVVTFSKLPSFVHSTTLSYKPNSAAFRRARTEAKVFAETWINFLRQHHFKVVLLNSMVLCDLVAPSKAAGCAVVQVMRETAAGGENLYALRERFEQADILVHISSYDREFVRAKTPIVKVMPDWTDQAPFIDGLKHRDLTRKKMGIKPDDIVLIFTGGRHYIKGGATAAQSLQHIKSERHIHLLVTGYWYPPKAKSLFNQAKKTVRFLLGRRSKSHRNYQEMIHLFSTLPPNIFVHTLGFRNDVPALMSASDICLVPYAVPHQARPIFEAGFARLVCIVSDFDCFQEHIADESALRVPAGAPHAWGRAINQLVNDNDLRKHMAEAAYKIAVGHHSQANAEKYVKLFRSLIGQRDR